MLGYKIKNWEKIVTNKQNFGIDEGAFCDIVCPQMGYARRFWHRINKKMDYNQKWKWLNILVSLANIFVSSKKHFKELHSTHTAINPETLNYKWTETEWI